MFLHSSRRLNGTINKRSWHLIFHADVAGGYSSSMLDAIRRAVDTSKALCMQDAQLQPLSYKEAFRLATLGGSEGTQNLLHTLNSCEVVIEITLTNNFNHPLHFPPL